MRDLKDYILNSSNPDKLRELQRAGLQIPTTKIDYPEIDATPLDVIRHKATHAGVRVVVEDTSFEVVGKDVGVNIRWLVDGIIANPEDYAGRRSCVLCLLGVLEPDGQVYVYRGVTEGTLVYPRGVGFGFDSIFQPFGSAFTFAEAKPETDCPRTKAVKTFLGESPWRVEAPLHDWQGKMQAKS